MTYRLIASDQALSDVSSHLAASSKIALDCEAAGFHRYTDRLCLIQLSTLQETFLLDPLAIDPSHVLRPALENPQVKVVMHGADFDLRLLHRDLGIRVRGLFDTQAAATLLGATSIGLASLLEEYLGVHLSKAHQRADWARRPLPESYLEYASDDTRHLLALGERLEEAVRDAGREEWAEEEFRFLEKIEWTEEEVDPVTRVKGARYLTPRQVTSLRAALKWRDDLARARDRAPFRVVGDSALLAVVQERPGNTVELADIKGISRRLAETEGGRLLKALEEVDGLPETRLSPFPRPARNDRGRPSPEEENKAEEIRHLRAVLAEELGMDKGILLSNAQIGEIVRSNPNSTDALQALPGVRRWQMDLLGSEILRVLKRK